MASNENSTRSYPAEGSSGVRGREQSGVKSALAKIGCAAAAQVTHLEGYLIRKFKFHRRKMHGAVTVRPGVGLTRVDLSMPE